MAIRIEDIRAASSRGGAIAKSVQRADQKRKAFLCHSHKDEQLVNGIIALLNDSGWDVYVDWKDGSLPETPSAETAAKIKQSIRDCTFFLFLATRNSVSSRWCPWEIGIADGAKLWENIMIIPVSESGQTHGNEYLQLYRHVDYSESRTLGVWNPKQTHGSLLIYL